MQFTKTNWHHLFPWITSRDKNNYLWLHVLKNDTPAHLTNVWHCTDLTNQIISAGHPRTEHWIHSLMLCVWIMGDVLVPPRWFSFLCPFLSLTGSTLSPSAPAGSRAAEPHLSESGCLALCRSAEPCGPEMRQTNTQTTPTNNLLVSHHLHLFINTDMCTH